MVFIDSLSNSKEDTFNDCKFKFLLKYIDKIPATRKTEDGALRYGNFIHKVFELNPSSTTLKELEDTALSIEKEYSYPPSYKERNKTCFINYLALIASFNHKIEQPKPEWYYSLKIDENIKILGVIDRVVKGNEGGILVIDWKTGKEKSKSKLMNDTQLLGYALACNVKFKVPIAKITTAHFYPVTNKFIPIKFSSQQVHRYIKERREKYWKILKLKKSELLPCQNENCNFCEYQNMCPLFGGTMAMYSKKLQENKEIKKDSRMNRGDPEIITLENLNL